MLETQNNKQHQIHISKVCYYLAKRFKNQQIKIKLHKAMNDTIPTKNWKDPFKTQYLQKHHLILTCYNHIISICNSYY